MNDKKRSIIAQMQSGNSLFKLTVKRGHITGLTFNNTFGHLCSAFYIAEE